MKNFDWLQAFAMEQQEQPEPGVSADAAPQDEQERAEAFRALIQGPYKKDYDRQVQMIVRERLKNCARSEQVLKSLGPALEKTFGVDAAQLTPEQAERLAACAPEGKVPVTKEQREEAMRQGYEALREQFAAVREAYPGAQLHEELESPVFMRLVMRGVDARSAYELTHLRELRAGAMAYGARRAREELAAAPQAGGRHGPGSGRRICRESGALVQTDERGTEGAGQTGRDRPALRKGEILMNLKQELNLQLFADAGTLVNASGNYVNAYSGETSAFPDGGGMTASMKTFYDTELLENARPELIHTQFARKQALPAGRGKTVEWRKWNTLEDAGALTEGVIPTGQKFGQSAVTQAITQYGTYVSVSDQLELHAIDDVILGAAEELGASAGTTQDKLVRNVAAAGTNVQYCDKVGTNGAHTAVTSRAGLDTTAKLTPDEVNKAVTLLKKLKAPKIDGKYIAIIHPSVAYDLRSSEAWIEAHKYAGLTELFTGEIGELHGVRFIETTEAKIFNGEGCPVKTAADESKGTPAEYYSVYATLFLGKDAYGMIDPEGGNLEMIIKDKGQVGGPLNQFSTLGYKFSSAAKILYEDRMVRVESCGAYSAEDEAN